MGMVPTVRVKLRATGEEITVNVSDVDLALHRLDRESAALVAHLTAPPPRETGRKPAFLGVGPLPTVAIVGPGGERLTINEHDYDPDLHELWGGIAPADGESAQVTAEPGVELPDGTTGVVVDLEVTEETLDGELGEGVQIAAGEHPEGAVELEDASAALEPKVKRGRRGAAKG